MPKEKIAIISVLKPVDDTRAFEKIANSLSMNTTFEIHLYGQPSWQELSPSPNIEFHSHTIRPKGINRIWIRFLVFLKLAKLKPELIICNTHELLIVTFLCKILFGSKILYDIQENYYFNLKYQGNFTSIIANILAVTIRLKEKVLSPIFDHFILAEKSYEAELTFIKNRYTIIENKCVVPDNWQKSKHKQKELRILFSGTITKSNGIFKALNFMEEVHKINPKIEFVIIGHCPNEKLRKHLLKNEFQFIEQKISKNPIPHTEILEQIKKANFGLICYELNPSNQNCMPTKVYEYTALGLPSIIDKGGVWESYILSQNAGIMIDYLNLDHINTAEILTNEKSLLEIDSIQESKWHEESELLNNLILKYVQ
ncbi:MAG: glycosyltransferase [Reichenbachiella sp.]